MRFIPLATVRGHLAQPPHHFSRAAVVTYAPPTASGSNRHTSLAFRAPQHGQRAIPGMDYAPGDSSSKFS